MKRVLLCLLILLGFVLTGCEQSQEREDRDTRLTDGPQLEVTVQP